MKDLPDRELLALFASGKEEKAFRTIVDRHLPAVWEMARSRTKDPQAAQDLAQEAFVLLARQAGHVRAEVLSGWLFLTVRNLAAKWVRSNARRHRREIIYSTDPAMEYTPSSGDPSLLLHILVPALDELPSKERDMLLGRYFENRTCREIAGALGSTEEAVRKRTARALEKLRLILARRGFPTSAAALGGAITSFASIAPPAGLAQTITSASLAAVSGTAVITGFSAILGMIKTAEVLAAAAIVAVGSTAYMALRSSDKAGTAAAKEEAGNGTAVRPDSWDRDGIPEAAAKQAAPKDGGVLNINREGLDPGELRSAEVMAAYLFKVNDELGKGMPREQIQKTSLDDARKEMEPLRNFLPLSPESADAMERILTERAANHIKGFYWNDHDMVDLLRANKSQFIEAMALKLMNGKPQFGDTDPELERRSVSWTPGVREAAVKFLKSYAAMGKRSRNVMDTRDWTEDESTLASMRGTVPPEQVRDFDQFVTERQAIVREGRALTRSQELAESLQLDGAQRQAVFDKLLESNREDKAGMEALFNETQRLAYRKK